MNDLLITNATIKDAETIQQLAIVTAIDAWSVSDYVAEAERDGSILLVAEAASIPEGFLLARLCPGINDGLDTEIFNIAVSPAKQRLGIAKKLFEHFVARCREEGVGWVWLEVRSANQKALEFYKNLGFIVFDTRHGFYSSPADDALVMGLSLGSNTSEKNA